MTLAAALTRLNSWTFTGLKTNKGHSLSVPPVATELPTLVVELAFSYEGLAVANVGFTQGLAVFHVAHLLLSDMVGMDRPEKRITDLVTLLDAYLSKVASDFRLNDNLAEPISIVASEIGPVRFMSMVYFGVRLTHRWVLKVV